MPRHVILPRIAKPPLKKIIKTAVKKQIIAQPKQIQRQTHQPISYSPIKILYNKPNQLKKLTKSKEPIIKYATPEPSPESLAQIQRLRNTAIGRILVILGNGPSLNELELEKLRGLPKVDTLMVNRPEQRIWPTTYWAFFDKSQQRRHKEFIDSYSGQIFNSTSVKLNTPKALQLKNRTKKQFSLDLTEGIHIGRSSVYASMQIALWLGYSKIYILGVDMSPDGIDGKLHYYGTNPDVDPKVRKMSFVKESEYYKKAITILGENAKKFIFASNYNPWDFVNNYSRLDHKIVINEIIKESVNNKN